MDVVFLIRKSRAHSHASCHDPYVAATVPSANERGVTYRSPTPRGLAVSHVRLARLAGTH